MNKFINLTAHTINELYTGLKIEPSGVVARVEQLKDKNRECNGVPLFDCTYGELRGLPAPKDNIMYIVSSMALNAVPSWRKDVIAPGFVKRKQNGEVLGCMGFNLPN